ncbi:MAG: sigma-70 family RNA polymerase sigma factor [Chloroflexi bacterium]|nr:sigma-70 family RNA polymerase sigma factor [Chloroflexota bacterium]
MVGKPDDEAQLVRAAQRGDLDAFNTLVLRYQDSAFTLAYRLLNDRAVAADVAQEAMITAFQRLRSLRGENFRAWLLRIVTNRCYDEMRRQRRRPTVSLTSDASDEDLPIPDPGQTPEEVAQQRELEGAIQRCIAALNADQRLVLVLCDVEGMEYHDIAQSIGAQIGTVKSRISRARSSVRDCLKKVRELLPSSYRLIIDGENRTS